MTWSIPVTPSQDKLAAELGITPEQVAAGITRLVETGQPQSHRRNGIVRSAPVV